MEYQNSFNKFLSGGSTDAVCSLVQIGEITWEEFEKVGLRHFANLRKKMVNENGLGPYHDIQYNSVNGRI